MFLTHAVFFLFVSHWNDVLILSGLSGPLLLGFVFSHLWSFNFKLRLIVFVSVVDFQIFEITFLAQREITVLQGKHYLSPAKQS